MSSYILRSPNLRAGDKYHTVRVYDPPGFAEGGLLSHFAEATRRGGRGGDDILLHINPEEFAFLQREWGEPSTNPHTGLPEYGLFSKLKKALKFESFNVKNIIKDIAKNPQRLLTGAVDPLGTKITNKMFGTNYDPVVNQLGGATEQRFRDAEARGMDTGTARDLHKAAGLVAGFYGGNALGNLAASGLSNVAAADTLSPMITTVEKTNAISPVVTTAGQTSTGTLGNMANAGATALTDLGPKTLNAAKNPKNWGTIAKGVGALGALGGSGGEDSGPPPDDVTNGGNYVLNPANFNWGRRQGPEDYYHYGAGPQHQFFGPQASDPDITLPYQPPPPTRMAEGGGMLREFRTGGSPGILGHLVRGPGDGRSDDIPARLARGEFVFDAETVALLGNGSTDAGAERLEKLRRGIRAHKGKKLVQGKFSDDAKDPMQYMGEG